MDLGNLASLRHFHSGDILAAGILILVITDLAVRDKSRLGWLALIVAAASLIAIGLEPASWARGCSIGCWYFDSFAIYFRLLTVGPVVAIWMSMGSQEVRGCTRASTTRFCSASTFASS